MYQYLVVANHTLGGQELLDAIRDRMARGPAEFWVLVPTTPTTLLINDFNALSCAFPVDPGLLPSAADARTREQSMAEAKSNLETELERLREIGATADGAVGDPNPMKAIEKTLAREAIRRDHPLHAAARHLPLARLGPAAPRTTQN